jgi:hypothetical protein
LRSYQKTKNSAKLSKYAIVFIAIKLTEQCGNNVFLCKKLI